MREILFRGKRIDNGEWITGYYAKQSNHACFANELKYTHFIYKDVFMDWNLGGLCETEVDPKTIGQYTGLNDKNGNPIFEGDIVKGYWGTIFTVFYDECRLQLRAKTQLGIERDIDYYQGANDSEVIGNIYDNPELLRSETK